MWSRRATVLARVCLRHRNGATTRHRYGPPARFIATALLQIVTQGNKDTGEHGKSSVTTLSLKTATTSPRVPLEKDALKWTTEDVANWCATKCMMDVEDLVLLKKAQVNGMVLLQSSYEELRGFLSFGAAKNLAQQIPYLQEVVHVTNKPPPFHILPIPGNLQLKTSDNCIIYQLGKNPQQFVHIGLKRISTAVQQFLAKQHRDATQQKTIVMVLGSPKSGKTTEAQVILPYLLTPHIASLLNGDFMLPCHTVYIDCTATLALTTACEKLAHFYSTACNAFGLPEKSWTTDPLKLLQDLFSNRYHYTLVSLDEFQMLLANLTAMDRLYVATSMRNIMLDSHSPCQFIVTGSTGAALIATLEEAPQNGISLFKDAGEVVTDYQSSADDLEDTITLLAQTLPFKQGFDPFLVSEIHANLGHVNCAIVNLTAVQVTGGESLHASIKRVARGILAVYIHDYYNIIKHHKRILSTIHTYVHGSFVEPDGAWAHFMDEIPLKGGNHLYIWKEHLFAIFLIHYTTARIDDNAQFSGSVINTLPILDLMLLFRIIPLVKNQKDLHPDFQQWFQNWPHWGDISSKKALFHFLAEHQVAYHAKHNHTNTKTVKEYEANPTWLSNPKSLLCSIYNSTLPHDEFFEGDIIKTGGHLFISYFGKGSRKRATQFLLEARQYLQK